MSDDELLDVFDEMGRHRGIAERRRVHEEGMWHQVCHVLVVADRAGTPTVVLQRRAATKATFPGLFDLSATGHLAAGERPRDGVRELEEELGAEVDPGRLVALGVRRIVDETPEGLNREMAHVFLLHDDRPLADYRPDPREVDAVADLVVADGLELLVGGRDHVRCEVVDHHGRAGTASIRRTDLVPEAPLGDVGQATPPGYWTTLLVMAERSARGETVLAI